VAGRKGIAGVVRMRRVMLIPLAGFVVTLGLVYLLATPPRPRITKEQFLAVKEGMTRAEVEKVLGHPPGTTPPRGGRPTRTG